MEINQLLGNSIFTKVLFFSALAIAAGDFLATLFTIVYQRYWYNRVMKPKFGDNFSPKCSIFVPCKGIPKDLGNNLKGFLKQDYADYEVVFVVESEKDPAVPTIKSIMEGNANVKLAIAGLSTTCAQKNYNLLAALRCASDSEVYVFADSDICPDGKWLKEIIMPLADSRVTVTSGFRWLNAPKGTIGELTHSYVNVFMYVLFSVACFFGGVGLWGGSMAIRKKDFDELEVAQKWSRTVVDDMSLSQIVMKKSRKAVLIPPCITHTDDLLQTVRGTVTWFERQIMFLKAYQKPLWFFLAMPISLVVLALILLLPVSIIASMSAGKTFLGIGGGAALVFYIGELLTVSLYPFLGSMRKFPKFLILQPYMRLAQLLSCFRTLMTNTITWAGIKYKLDFSGDVASIERPGTDC
ncbi:MAG: glycosyltransferase family 2 protein [Fibrobacter sp.]|nr:glycosyltransferase family 2 protein [Fibrobacter sp.]